MKSKWIWVLSLARWGGRNAVATPKPRDDRHSREVGFREKLHRDRLGWDAALVPRIVHIAAAHIVETGPCGVDVRPQPRVVAQVLAAHAELAYRRLMQDWQPAIRGTGAGPGRASRVPSTRRDAGDRHAHDHPRADHRRLRHSSRRIAQLSRSGDRRARLHGRLRLPSVAKADSGWQGHLPPHEPRNDRAHILDLGVTSPTVHVKSTVVMRVTLAHTGNLLLSVHNPRPLHLGHVRLTTNRAENNAHRHLSAHPSPPDHVRRTTELQRVGWCGSGVSAGVGQSAIVRSVASRSRKRRSWLTTTSAPS